MPYWQLFYHIIWSTKNRLPLLTPDIEPIIYGYLRSKAIALEARVFTLNGTPDHVHLVVSIPPKIPLAKFIGQVKAVASTRFNKSGIRSQPFFWQEEYGVFSFDGKRLPNYIAYVEGQKEHHRHNTTISALERSDDNPMMFVHESMAEYILNDASWRREFE